jgi:protein-tyrosine phosphatase
MIDLHCHILPGIDDGAKSLAESIAMCRAAATAGCEAMVATPHQRRGVWWNGDRAALAALRGELSAAVAPEIQIYSGGEIHVDRELLAEVARLAAGEEAGILPLAGSRYLLLEFAASWTAPTAADLVHELIVAGWRPVLAHPELIPFLAEDEAVIAHLVSLGAMTQVTAMSLTGDFGRRAQLFVRRLVDAGLAHFVASDSHDLLRRPPGLARAFAALQERWGEATALALTTDNPRAVVEDRPLPPLPPIAPIAQTSERRLRRSAHSPRLAGIARIAGILLLSMGVLHPVRAATPAATAPAAATATTAPPPAAPAPPDPFYLGLLRDGRIAYDRGDFPTAAKDLRLACFGLLDDPQPLTDCLVRLAVAQGAGNDNEGFRDTFRRLAEVEDRFGGYSKAQLPPELRAAFEQKLVVLIPSATLATLPVWRQLLPHKAEAEIAALPPKERRKELEARLAKDPRNLTWNLLAAELDLDEGKAEPAIARAEQAAASAPQDPRATCMRGLARAYGRHCPEALADLEPCPLAAREARYATALLGCRVELGAWRKAEEQVRGLPPQLREDKRIAALAEQVAQHPAGPATTPGSPAAPAGSIPKPVSPPLPEKPTAKPAPSPAATPIPPAAGQPGRPLSLAEREATERVHRLLAASSSAKDLKEALRLARQVADAHPDVKEAQYLAGETAYRNSRWTDAVAFFRRTGEPGDDRPELLFYLAVSLFEAGDQPAATAALKRSLPRLQKTPYVDSYVRRITGSPASGPAGGAR